MSIQESDSGTVGPAREDQNDHDNVVFGRCTVKLCFIKLHFLRDILYF